MTEEANPTEEVLHATPGELRQWQQEDSSLENVRGRAEQQQDPKARVQFFYRDGLLYHCWCPRGCYQEMSEAVSSWCCRDNARSW